MQGAVTWDIAAGGERRSDLAGTRAIDRAALLLVDMWRVSLLGHRDTIRESESDFIHVGFAFDRISAETVYE